MTELKRCPFCGGKGKVSFKNYQYYGKNYQGDRKLKYRVQVICNKCRSRGKPVITDWLINPLPYISKWGNCGDGNSPRGKIQTKMCEPYVERAIEAWNRRAGDDNEKKDSLISCDRTEEH